MVFLILNGYSSLGDSAMIPIKRTSVGISAAASSGLGVLVGFVVVLLCVVLLARAHHATIPNDVALTLICFAFGWVYLALWKVHRGCRRLGWDRSHYTQLLSGSRPDDPDELLIWWWTLQLLNAILAVVLCVLAIAFAV